MTNHELAQRLLDVARQVLGAVDYKKVHGHDRAEVNSVEWYFHNYATHGEELPGYNHCEGGEANPYLIEHVTVKGKMEHGIDKEYARGHGEKRKPQWFKFTNKIKNGLWDLASGEPVNTADVPKRFK